MSADIDAALMRRALEIAARARYTTKPNPMVGCVLVSDGAIVGEGWHQRAGEPHAETLAIRDAGARARGATAYVTLEPCAHVGRTGPCADALIEAGIARAVAAIEDPDPRVAGKGFNKLRAAGIAVEVGVEAAAARALNRGFLSRIERRRPWVRLKLAMSVDGRTALADGRSQWITGIAARADAMRLRAEAGAIVTGIGTVLADDPHLTVRFDDATPFVAPLRVVLDTHLRIPGTARVLDESAPTLIVAEPEAIARRRDLPSASVLSCPHHATGLGLAVAMAELAARGVGHAHVECGPRLAGALIEAALVDELVLYVNPSLIGDSGKALVELPPLDALDKRTRLGFTGVERVGDDLKLTLEPIAA